MNKKAFPNKPARWSSYARLLSCCAALVLAPSAHAVCVAAPGAPCLADQPIQSSSVVKPNVMFLLDNSGSMDWDYMPDSQNGTTARRRNYQSNTVYYNPNFNYTTAIPNKPNTTTGAIEAFPTQTFTAAQCDPFINTVGVNGCAPFSTITVDLRTAFRAYNGDTAQAAYYCKKVTGAPAVAGPCNMAGYTQVVVGAASCTISGDVTSCPTGADERVNFANWFSYYRTRLTMMKSGMASAFSPLTDSYRIGFYTINGATNSATSTNGAARNIVDFSGGASGTPKGDWYATLFRQRTTASTPLQQALNKIGQYYEGTPPTGLSDDPIQYSCQKNFTIMSTDGGWNGPNTGKGDQDRTVPAVMPIKADAAIYNPSDTRLTPGSAFPMPYYEGTAANTDTLADIAMHYWVRDLRPAIANNVATTSLDPAYWQHMTTYTIGLGVQGTLTTKSPSSLGDWCALQDSAHLPAECVGYAGPWKTWPATPSGGNTNTTDPSKFDDLWHAAVNARGEYYSAQNPATLAAGLGAALHSIDNSSNFGVGPASSTNDFKSPDFSDYTTYVSSYHIDNWSGNVEKFDLDRSTGLATGTALWSAAKQLDSKVNPGLTATVNPTAYTTRNIVTRNDLGTAVDFAHTVTPSATTLSASQLTALCYKAPPGTGPCIATDPSLINYLRGDATYEGGYGVGASRFRDRHDARELTYFKRNLIGSIVNAKPAYVAVEQEIYQDNGYAAFKKASKTRAPALYVGANDGMMHALDAATGDELWAYVPSMIIPNSTDENGKEKSLRAVSYQDSGGPAFNHHFYLDGPLEVGAIDANRTGGPAPINTTPAVLASGIWKNIMVGGLGKGGKGYYALDVTAPAISQADAKTKVMWEFPSASDASHAPVITGGQMGYSYGRPIIAKTYTYGWVVMLPSGFSNSDGYGYVFVLDADTGHLLETLKTTTPAPGMAHITMLGAAKNKYAMQVYSGDLDGNIWRFDFSQTPLTPRVSAIFTSSSSTPITTEINVSIDGNTGDRWVFFGTGQYLDVADRTSLEGYQQYIGALRDGTLATPRTTTIPPGPSLVPVTLTSLATVTDLMTGVSSAPLGWRYALPTRQNATTDPTIGERNAMKPMADLRTVIFASLIPTTDVCSPGTSGYAYALEYSTGKTRMMLGTTLIPYAYFKDGISSTGIKMTNKGTGGSGSPQGEVCDGRGNCVGIKLDLSKLNSGTRHVGWRELLNEY